MQLNSEPFVTVPPAASAGINYCGLSPTACSTLAFGANTVNFKVTNGANKYNYVLRIVFPSPASHAQLSSASVACTDTKGTSQVIPLSPPFSQETLVYRAVVPISVVRARQRPQREARTLRRYAPALPASYCASSDGGAPAPQAVASCNVQPVAAFSCPASSSSACVSPEITVAGLRTLSGATSSNLAAQARPPRGPPLRAWCLSPTVSSRPAAGQ